MNDDIEVLITLPRAKALLRDRRIVCRTKKVLRGLGIPPGSVTVEHITATVAARLGVGIELVSHTIPVPGMFGATLGDNAGYVVFYQRETSPMHQAHHVAHELAHILTGTMSGPGVECGGTVERDAETVAGAIMCWSQLRTERNSAQTETSKQNKLVSVFDDLAGWA